MLLPAKTRGMRRKQFSFCSRHMVCVHCCRELSKSSLFALTHAVIRWRHCWTAHAWWHGLTSP